MKILHVTHHRGCQLDFEFVCKRLGHELTTQFADWNYNVGHNRANEIWNKYKDYYSQFDVIITSDTAPLSRIFLQNNYNGKLIIWVCNRFDYADEASNDCKFPDKEYYDLIRAAINKKNVKIYSYTEFEHKYAQHHRGINWGEQTIKPCSVVDKACEKSNFPNNINKSETFLVTRYHNDNILLNLKSTCDGLGIKTYNGEYNGPEDLVGIKGIIHIPYAWSNLALFENWSIGNVYFIPSKQFLLQLSNSGNFFWSPPFDKKFIDFSEWYLPAHNENFIFFDNWNHLKDLTNNESLISNKKEKILLFSKNHTQNMLNQWSSAINNWT